MTAPSTDTIPQVLKMTATVLGHAGGVVVNGAQHTAQLYDEFMHGYEAVQSSTWAVMTVCFLVAVIHAQYSALAQKQPFPLLSTCMRLGAVLVLFLGYDKICGLIFHLLGNASSGWMSWSDVGSMIGNGRLNPLNYSYSEAGWDPAAIGKSLLFLALWLLMMAALLFAFVVGSVLSMIQAAFITVLLALGPYCIVLSVLPGVGTGKGWARALAMTAAWSLVGGAITHILSSQVPDLVAEVRAGDVAGMLRGSAQFIIIGLGMMSVPGLTAKVASGAAPAVAGIAGAAFMAFKGGSEILKGAVNGASKSHQRENAVANGGGVGDFLRGESPQSGGGDGGGLRPHKVGLFGGGGMPSRTGALGGLVGGAVGAALMPMAALGGLARRGAKAAAKGGSGRPPQLPSGTPGKSEGAEGAAAALVGAASSRAPAPVGVSRAEGPAGFGSDLDPAGAKAAPLNDRLPVGVSMSKEGQHAMFKRGDEQLACVPLREAEANPGRALGQALATAQARGRDNIPADIKAHYGLGQAAAAAPSGNTAKKPALVAPGAAVASASPTRPNPVKAITARRFAGPAGAASSAPEASARPAAAAPTHQPAPMDVFAGSRDDGALDRPTDALTVRNYPPDGVTPLAMEPRVARNVVRRPKESNHG